MDKEEVVYLYNGILLGHKKDEITLFAATWIDLETVILMKKSGRGEILYGIPFMQNL